MFTPNQPINYISLIDMNKKLLLTLTVAGAVGAGFAAKKDPAVMRIAGKDVPRSEFEYLYNKNAGQQLEQQSLEDYAELFKIYKLKVADALAEGLDTTASFKKELMGYQAELARPYMIDSTYYKQLMHEMYDRAQEEVEARHIMIFKPREFGGIVSRSSRTLADSLLTELRNGADFDDLARRFSQDRGSASRGGYMGYITSGMTPYNFETAVYTLSDGQISDIIESGVGLHIVKGGKHRPARGSVQAYHILKLVPEDATPEEQAAIKAEVDSIYKLAIDPASSFEALAAKLSDDKGSARQGGNVGWFGCGRMVEEFDSAAFALPLGGISEPVRTRYGWHIIKKTGEKPVGTFEENADRYRALIENPEGGYGNMIGNHFAEKLRKKYHFKENTKLFKAMQASALDRGMDSTFYAKWGNDTETLAQWDGRKYSMEEFMTYLKRFAPETNGNAAQSFLRQRFDNFVNVEMQRLQLSLLPEENEAYRNLLGEYRDGMLLFEVSNQKVWDKAAKDTEGLEEFFRAHREDYTWKTPHVKGLLVQCPSDSVMLSVQERIATLPADEVVTTVRKEFPGVKIDEMLVAKGDNMLVDALAFGSEPVQNPDSKYPAYFMSNMRVITAPEEAADVRGQVTADYQNELERRWVEELRAKYPIEVYQKELSKVKPAK